MPKMTPAQVRALFPATQRASYLNAAAASPIATTVNRAIVDHYREGMEWGDVDFEAWLKRKDEIRVRFGKLIGARAEDVAFLGSTSLGFDVVARMLLGQGVREVVTLAGEFPSTTLPLMNRGLRLRIVKPRGDGAYSLEDIDAAIGPKSGALVASAVQYSSGFRLDLKGAKKLCRARGMFLAVNAAQALGQVPIDVTAGGIDFLCATSHKWMMGGYGVGVFYARRALFGREGAMPLASWLSVRNPMAMDNLAGAQVRKRRGYLETGGRPPRFRRSGSALEIGSAAFGPIFGFGEALAILEGVGLLGIQKHNARLQVMLREGLRQRGFVPNAPDDPRVSSGICVVPVRGDAEAAVRELGRKGVVVTPRGGGVRISTHIFNTEEDLEQLFWALDKMALQAA